MAAKKKKKAGKAQGHKKFQKPAPVIKKPQSMVTGRFESTLTDALVDELVMVHEEGDLLPSTALACGVHPTLLRQWLETGSKVDATDPHARLFASFAVIESQIRRKCLKDIREPWTKNSNGIAWYMQRRFKEWREDAAPREGEVFAVSELLLPKPGGMNKEAAKYIIEQLSTHPEFRPMFEDIGRKMLQEGQPNEPEEPAAEADDGVDDGEWEEPGDDDTD